MAANVNSSQTNRLLQRPLGKDPQALDELFGRHRERLRRMVRLRLDRRLRGRFNSSAVLQQVYLDMRQRLNEFLTEPAQPFFLWLRQLAGQRIQELHRQHLGAQADAGQELTLYRGALPEVNSVSLAAQLMGERGANQVALRADMMLQLQGALNGMDPLDREVLALCHFEELTEPETAAVLGLRVETVTLHYLRALKRLKEILNAIPGFFDKPPGVPKRFG
jgi:RNA polymerase sigma-70 factor (ECF subfamily)